MDPKLKDLLIEKLKMLQLEIAHAIIKGMRVDSGPDTFAQVADTRPDDTIYRLDKMSDEVILSFFEIQIKTHVSCQLVAEGFDMSDTVFTPSGRADDAEVIIIMDPIDGSRGLMHGKRSAWSLAAAAPNLNSKTTLNDLALAVQTEIPRPKQTLFDQLWAVSGCGVKGLRHDINGNSLGPIKPSPSRANGIEHGFATFCRFFPGVKDIIAEIEEEFARRVAGYTWPILYFEDQYVSTGGQLFELMMGHDRFVCDLRAVLAAKAHDRGDPRPLCCHPYDICCELIAREAGVVVTDLKGGPLRAPLDNTSNVSWVAFANSWLQDGIGPILNEILLRRRLI